MWSLISLNEGCIRHVGDYLSTLDAYRLVVALKAGSRDEVTELPEFNLSYIGTERDEVTEVTDFNILHTM